ncbi:uncharacterized protein buc2l [Osmerus mordax]|uniref:uncharacterized protein buc2l n=1 Tax=Osmerus mordax TaxID=8014 RepID=UPI0035101A3F
MAAAQCVNGPHGRPGPRQPVPLPGTEAPNPGHGPPGTGAHGSIHPPPPHHHQPRPYFYMQPPPMPPLMHYQWPMPIPYNPYSGFPGMGYGMVMPQFPPTAFMEPPGYVLPHAQLHPADYRRVLQPPYHQSAAHYQNLTQNPNRRFHFQQNPGYVPKETVSSEVQTEPMVPDVRKASPAFGNKDPLAGSDSGRGTSSSAPSSPGSSEGKAGSCPEEERNSVPSSTSKALFLDKGRSKGVGAPTGRKKSQSRRISIEALARVGADLGHFDMSVCSTDSMVPVCSSSNRDDDVIEGRRVSFPDILMGGVGSPAVTKTPDVPRCEHKEPQEVEEKEECDLTPEDCDLISEQCDSPEDCDLTPEDCDLTPEDCDLTPEDCDSPEDCDLTPEDGDFTPENCNVAMDEMVNSHSKILKLPFKLHEYILGPKKVDESVWSVESLAPYIPTTEWLIQNGLLNPENVPQLSPYNPSTEWLIQNDLPDPENVPQRVLETSDQDDTVLQQKSFEYVQFKKIADESVWSVDSLAPYVPSADWLIQNDSQNYENVIKEKESDPTDSSQTQLLKRMMAAKESRQKLLFSESSMDSLPPYVPSASWLADQGNVYYCSKLLLSSQQDVNVFLSSSDKHGMYRRPNMESELGHSKQQQQEGNPKRSLNFEFLEKVDLESSQALPSTIPNVERDPKNCTLEGSIEHEHKARCSPNPRALDAARNPCSPEHPKPTISIHIEEVERGHGKHKVELEQEMARNGPKEPSQQMLEKMVMDALTSMSIPAYMGHSMACGLQCFKLLERNCPCEDRPKQQAGACRKSPLHTGSDEDRTKQHTAAYRKSPLHTGSDEDRPKQHAVACRKSPLHTGSDEDRPKQHTATCRKSPLHTGSDEDRTKQHAAAYRKSPLHTGSDEDRPKQHASACRKSPLHTGSDEDRPKQHASAYRKSPLHTGSDEDRPKQHAAAYRKSPLHTGSDEDRPKQHAAGYRKSPLHTGRDDNPGNMPPDASKRQGKRRGNGFQWKTESKRANKARIDREWSDTGHGQRNAKKYVPWKNRPQQDRSQTNPTNKPFNQRTGQRNRQERPIMATMADLENQEEEMEGTH